ncbi:prolyl oligopeptidase family serine peptidase [Blastococcus montanus]|uniref:S9 family peptidase n=1 Tax=Blastococcus montanus TaxID=3144973 RepID=UPI003209B59C
MRPTDLALLRTPGTPTLSPDGRIAVVAVGWPDPDADDHRSQLWAVPTDGSAPARPLTSGRHDTDPVFSPDGRWLAYLGAEPGRRAQIHVLPAAGGAPRRLTDHHLGAGAPVWSPDSRRLAYVARVPEHGRYGTVAGVDPAAEPPRLITTLRYRLDGVGFVRDRPSQVFVIDLPADFADDTVPPPAPVQVTTGEADCADVAWRPDGAELAFVSARHDGADRDPVRDVHAVAPDGSGLRRVTGSRADCALPAYTADGTAMVVTAVPDRGPDGPDVVGWQAVPCRVAVAGGALQPLLDPAERRGGAVTAPVLADGAALAGVERRGAVELLRVPVEGGAPETLIDGPFTVRGVAAAAGVVVATVGHDRSAGELVALTPGGRRLLTGFGRELGATGRLHRTSERTATAPDGRPVHGWVTTPPGPGPHPVLLVLPGGPVRQPGWALSVDTQVYVSAGYAVVRCDPRGSSGHGPDHGRAGPGELGGPDVDDVLTFLDAALLDPALDGERIGIAGSSSGGYLAALLLGRTDRFAAAVLDAAITDPGGLIDSAGTGWCVADDGTGTASERPAAQSPPAWPGRSAAPTLVIHGEEDARVPAREGERLYVELVRHGVPAELLLFPGEGHELARTGRPRHRLARLEHLLRWWGRWLPPPQVTDGDLVSR